MSYITGFTDSRVVNQQMVLASGKLAFDIGANGGYVAKVLARAFDKVVACEPAIESFERLVPRCPVPNLICLNVAVSDHEGEVVLEENAWTESHGELFTGNSLDDIWGDNTGKRTVECTTLDKLAEYYGMPTFVKVDTEGHESHIINGGLGVLSERPRFIIEIHSAANGEHIEGVLHSMNLPYEISRHESYAHGSFHYLNHYWLVSK